MEGNICELLVFLDALLTAELHAFVEKQRTFCGLLRRKAAGRASVREWLNDSAVLYNCLELGGCQTITTFAGHNFNSWVSSMIVRFTNPKGGSNKAFQSFQLTALLID